MMKKFNKTIKAIKTFLFAFLLFAAGTTNAQVGIGTPTPNASAQLDVSSINKGFLPPRMTQAQRNAISSPVAGLIIWCKDCDILGELQVYNGFTWTNIGTPLPATITIGQLIWMTRNLDVVTYRNGDTIPQVTDPTQWANLTTGAWCYYDNDPVKGAIYGKLYNLYAVNDPRGLAPTGWHIPSGAALAIGLVHYLGDGTVAAAKMRATPLWNNPNLMSNNESGFTGLPGGQRNSDGSFTLLGSQGVWWSTMASVSLPMSSKLEYVTPLRLDVNVNLDQVDAFTHIFNGPPTYFIDTFYPVFKNGFSVRCVKD